MTSTGEGVGDRPATTDGAAAVTLDDPGGVTIDVADHDPGAPRPRRAGRRDGRPWDFGRWLLLLVGISVAGHLVSAVVLHGQALPPEGEAIHAQANLLARGHWFVDPFRVGVPPGPYQPAAAWSPLLVSYLALWSFVGLHTVFWHQVAVAVPAAVALVLVARSARRLGGDRAGLIAGVVALTVPDVWMWDSRLLAAAAAVWATALFAWLAVRYLDRPTAGRLVAVGAAVGLATLARPDLVLLAVAVPLMALRTRPAPHRFGRAVAALGVAALVVAPWAATNLVRLRHAAPLGTSGGPALLAGTCDSTFSGPYLGAVDPACADAVAGTVDPLGTTDGSLVDQRSRQEAWHYLRHHPARVPGVVGVRILRAAGLYRPAQQAQLTHRTAGVPTWLAGAALAVGWLLFVAAARGATALRRWGTPVFVVLAPAAVALFTVAAFGGSLPFRSPAMVVGAVLAGVGIDWWVTTGLERRRIS